MPERRDIDMSIRTDPGAQEHWRRSEEMFRRYLAAHTASCDICETNTHTYTETRWNDRWLPPDLETDLEEQFRNRVAQRNPEQDVLDDIDQLMIDGLEDEDEDAEDKCAVCENDWHGLPQYGCPGEYGTDKEKLAYRDIKQLREELNKRRDLIAADKWNRSRGFDADLVIIDEAHGWNESFEIPEPPDVEAIVDEYLNATTDEGTDLATALIAKGIDEFSARMLAYGEVFMLKTDDGLEILDNRNVTYPDCATCDGGGCGDCR
jgi:hypothetical protein